MKREPNLRVTLLIYGWIYVPDFAYAHELCLKTESTKLDVFYSSYTFWAANRWSVWTLADVAR